MERPLITSLGNPLIKQARALRQKKARAESGLFVVEGISHIGEAFDAGWKMEWLIYSQGLLRSKYADELVSRARDRAQPVSPDVLESIAKKDNPQGIVAIVHQKRFSVTDVPILKSAVALVSPQDPGNVGTILRTMDAVSADALFILDGGVELYHPSTVRSSMGAIFWKPVIQLSFQEFVLWSRQKDLKLIGTSAHADVEYGTLVAKTPWALVLGSEQKGLSQDQIGECDVTVSLPMKGRVSSLNLAVAAGILLYSLNK